MVIEGSVIINEKEVSMDYFVLFANDGTDIQIKSNEDSIVLVLSGEPINEPIVPSVPFVMNTQQEILEGNYPNYKKYLRHLKVRRYKVE